MPYSQEADRLQGPLDAIVTRLAKGVPRAVIEVAARIPDHINRPLIERFLNHALQRSLAGGEFDFLHGRTVKIQISDLDCSMTITSYGGRRLRLLATKQAETRISATTKDFIGLASGQTDPDTLFFQRRLRIEGNVALGLETKNTLDGVDREALPVPFKAMLQLAGAWLSRYGVLSETPSGPWPRLSSPARPYQ